MKNTKLVGINPFNIKKFKTGDQVIVISGKHKGEKTKIVKVLRDRNRVILENVNLYFDFNSKETEKPKKAMSVHISNIMHIDPLTDKPVRIGFRMNSNNTKERYSKASGEAI